MMPDTHRARGASAPNLPTGFVYSIDPGALTDARRSKVFNDKNSLSGSVWTSFLQSPKSLIDHDQFKFLGGSASGLQSPQIDDELPADGDHRFFL
jgi:hypothetical protein